MNILYLHGNYPAQFRMQVQALAANPRHRVVFATEREAVPAVEIPPGLELVQLQPHRTPPGPTHPYLHDSNAAVLLGQAVVRQLLALRKQGFQPQLVVYHAGRGLGLFLRQLLPQATLVAYCEWYFKPADLPWLCSDSSLKRGLLDLALKTSVRNHALLQELAEADLALTPTAWQRQQFPPQLRSQLQVVFDGIDTAFFQPGPAQESPPSLRLQPEGQEAPLIIGPEAAVLSYTTRGMEPLRGFPEFLRTLPALLAAFPQLQVVIAGRDRVAYSYPAPSHDGSWKEHLLAELGPFPGRERVHFTGLIPYGQLRALLQRTDLHVYFSRPYVTSWSLFEAAACGAPIAMNTGPATTGVLPEAAFVQVDLDQPASLAPALQSALERSLALRGQPRRSRLPEEFTLTTCQQRWQQLINAAIQSRRQPASIPGQP